MPVAATARQVRELLGCGATVKEIAGAAGLRPSVIAQLPWRDKGHVPPGVAAAIEVASLMLKPPDDPLVPTGATRRRVRELLACGKTLTEIADVAGLSPSLVGQLAQRNNRCIRQSVADAIELADLHLMGPPVPEEPDEVLVERILAGEHRGPVPRLERREAVRQLHGAGVGVKKIAARLDVSPRTVSRDLVILTELLSPPETPR